MNEMYLWIAYEETTKYLTFSWRRPLSYRKQSIDFLPQSMDWFLYDNGLRHERFKLKLLIFPVSENIYISFTFTLHILKEMLL